MSPKTPPKKRATAKKGRALVIAIDGPAGSGKSTVAAGVAESLGLRRLDTGAMYRALTLKALRSGVDPEDAPGLASLARQTRFDYRDSAISLDGRAAGNGIRRPEVSRMVSTVAAHPAVRRELVRRQREIIGKGGVVVEGRDIGTVVCPDADLKVFLTASAHERARRRSTEDSTDLHATAADLERRDRLDSTRAADPLAQADDAVVLDTTELGIDEVVARLVALLRPGSPA